MEHSFKKISIIGLGLIGGSIGLAVNRYDKNIRRIGVARSEETLEKAISRGLVDEATNKLNDAVDDADLVILATPLSSFKNIVKEILPFLKDNCIITDTGSTKSQVIDEIMEILPENIHFIPGHTIAGTEMSGPEAGFAELFDNRWCILTPLKDSNQNHQGKLENYTLVKNT